MKSHPTGRRLPSSHRPEAKPTVGRDNMSSRMSIPEIADRLGLGRLAVYTMLEQGIIPAIRLGRRWIVTRHAFENWERTCGMPTGLPSEPEHKVTERYARLQTQKPVGKGGLVLPIPPPGSTRECRI